MKITASDAYPLLNVVHAYAEGEISWGKFCEYLGRWCDGERVFDDPCLFVGSPRTGGYWRHRAGLWKRLTKLQRRANLDWTANFRRHVDEAVEWTTANLRADVRHWRSECARYEVRARLWKRAAKVYRTEFYATLEMYQEDMDSYYKYAIADSNEIHRLKHQLAKAKNEAADRCDEGAEAERAKVVAWLRDVVDCNKAETWDVNDVRELTDRIERGEHDKKEKL